MDDQQSNQQKSGADIRSVSGADIRSASEADIRSASNQGIDNQVISKVDVDNQGLISRADSDVDIYTCDICGKSFQLGGSLKAHKLRSHKISPKGERRETPSKEEGEKEEKPSIPDPYGHLERMLITFGVSDRNAKAVLEYMSSYSVDDLGKLIECTAEYLPRSRLKLFIESWANVRGISIPFEIAEQLEINSPLPPRSYTRYSRRPSWGEEEPADNPFVAAVKALSEYERSKNLGTPSDDGKVSAEIDALRTMVLELKEQLRKSEIDELKKEIQGLKTAKSDALTAAVQEAGKFLEGYTSIIAKALEVEDRPPKDREKVGESTVAEQLPLEYVEDQSEGEKSSE